MVVEKEKEKNQRRKAHLNLWRKIRASAVASAGAATREVIITVAEGDLVELGGEGGEEDAQGNH